MPNLSVLFKRNMCCVRICNIRCFFFFSIGTFTDTSVTMKFFHFIYISFFLSIICLKRYFPIVIQRQANGYSETINIRIINIIFITMRFPFHYFLFSTAFLIQFISITSFYRNKFSLFNLPLHYAAF